LFIIVSVLIAAVEANKDIYNNNNNNTITYKVPQRGKNHHTATLV